MAKLMFIDRLEPAVELTLGGVVIGRSQDAAIRTEDPLVSRKNTKIAFSSGAWCIEDLGSSNGTFVNETRVQRQALQQDDVIRCGSLRLRFVVAEGEAQRELPQQTINVAPNGPVPSAQMAPVQYEAPPTQAAPPPLPEGPSPEELALQARVDELAQKAQYHDDEVQALTRLGNELGQEVRELKDERTTLLDKVREMEEQLEAQNRQLERAHEEVDRFKQEAEAAQGQVLEAKKTAEEGWKQLKSGNADMEKLKRVMAQQEALLDQRRMGLSALEQAVQELRAEREKMLRTQVSLTNERDALRAELNTRQPAAYATTMELRGTGT